MVIHNKTKIRPIVIIMLIGLMIISIGLIKVYAEESVNLNNESGDMEGENSEESKRTDENLLNYLVIGKDYINTPDTQYVLVDIGNENTVVDSASIDYINVTTGIEGEKNVDQISGGTMVFNIDFTSTDAGSYQILSLHYACEGKEYSIDLADIGVSAKFGVDVQVQADPYAWILNEQECNDIAGIESSSTNGLDMLSAAVPTGGHLTVVLDPGHGGSDSGATRNWNGITYVERDINLKIAQACKEMLETYEGVTVYMTRNDNNTTLSLTERTDYAKSVNADVFISLHINSTSTTSTTAKGAEVIIPNANYNAEIHAVADELGQAILKKLEELGINNRGTWSRDTTIGEVYPDGTLADYYTVIYNSKINGIPGMIVEHAYISNEEDCNRYLGSDEEIKKIGIQDATAIASYYNLQSDSTRMYNGVDYSAVYDYNYYINAYPDIKAAFAGNPEGALEHFATMGMNEGRQGNEEFNVSYYKNRYVDLRNIYGSNLPEYYMHYINYGKNEKRDGKNYSDVIGAVTCLNGIDYSAVYSRDYYINKYNDIKRVYGNDDLAVLGHFVNYGMSEGRQAISNFNVKSYAYKYADLRRAYGNNLNMYYMHYMNYGKQEGRKATGINMMKNGTTVYNGVDYSAVYDLGYYANKYKDLRIAFGLDDTAYLEHFLNNGMSEGRQGKEEFNVIYYKNRYVDLREAFGADLKSYYNHYIGCGKSEGRDGKNYSDVQGSVASLYGIDYSAIYQYNYYIGKYGDIKRAYGNDDVAALQHFIDYGMQEGRRGNKEFIVSYYKANYEDLRQAYGEDLKQYYMHYIRSGKTEGRIANASIGYSIMGKGSVTVEQMVAYYTSHAIYPEYYRNSDAPDIQTFCRIYIEECNVEGVKTEVAFSQAMLETGFLKYGGDVDISQYNFAGMGATGGVPGLSFSSVREGIRAQIQHLKAYASNEALNGACVDPRFQYVSRGCAPYVEWLGINENPYRKGWAAAKNYGYTIRDNYISQLCTY